MVKLAKKKVKDAAVDLTGPTDARGSAPAVAAHPASMLSASAATPAKRVVGKTSVVGKLRSPGDDFISGDAGSSERLGGRTPADDIKPGHIMWGISQKIQLAGARVLAGSVADASDVYLPNPKFLFGASLFEPHC